MSHKSDYLWLMGDEKISQIQILLQILEQIEDLSLYGDIQGRGGLIKDHDLRAQEQYPAECHSLALPSGNLTGIAA